MFQHLPVQKFLIILTLVFALATAGVGYLNRGKLTEARQVAVSAKKEAADSSSKAAKTAGELKIASEKLAMMGSDSEKVASELSDLKTQNARYQSTVSDLQNQLTDRESTMNTQKADLAQKDAKLSELEGKVNQVTQSNSAPLDEMKKTVEEKDLLISSLQNKLKDQDSQLTNFKEREAQRRSKSMKKGLEGRILAVNNSWNFIVVSLGDRNGVINGAEMLIKRGSQLIGKVRITSVEPSTSIADIVANSVRSGLSVQPGDTVIYAGPADDSESATTNIP